MALVFTVRTCVLSIGPALLINYVFGYGPLIAETLLVTLGVHDAMDFALDSSWKLRTRLRQPGSSMMNFGTYKTVSEAQDKAESRRRAAHSYLVGAVTGCLVCLVMVFLRLRPRWGAVITTAFLVYLVEYAGALIAAGTHLRLDSGRRVGEGSGWSVEGP